MYEKDGEKYFIVDSHMHYWDASPDNWVQGPSSTPKAGSSASTPIRASARRRRTGPSSTSTRYSEEDLMKDVFEDGYVDMAIFQPTYLTEWYDYGLQHHRAERIAGREAPGQVHRQQPLGPAGRRRRSQAARGRRRAVGPQGRQALHGRVARAARAAGS